MAPKEVILRHEGERNPKVMLIGAGLAVLGLIVAAASSEFGAVLFIVGLGALFIGAQKRTRACPQCRTKISPRAMTCPQCHTTTNWVA